jgi:release factor glutamine methyltransferase
MITENKPRFVRETLQMAVSFLKSHSIPDAGNDALVLLGAALGLTKAKLLLAFPEAMPMNKWDTFRKMLEARGQGYPLQYLTGKQEFMSLPFTVTPAVLIPRPETELLVEKVINFARNAPEPLKIVDVCTGSGCIINSICYYVKKGIFLASDISNSALEIAKKNAQELGLAGNITFYQGDLLSLEEFKGADVIVSNPPYIIRKEIQTLQREVSLYEPKLALDGGEDGLEIYQRLIPQAQTKLKKSGRLFLEIGCEQGAAISELFANNGFINIEVSKDFNNLDRIVSGEKR